jgi:hypothetical protein
MLGVVVVPGNAIVPQECEQPVAISLKSMLQPVGNFTLEVIVA